MEFIKEENVRVVDVSKINEDTTFVDCDINTFIVKKSSYNITCQNCKIQTFIVEPEYANIINNFVDNETQIKYLQSSHVYEEETRIILDFAIKHNVYELRGTYTSKILEALKIPRKYIANGKCTFEVIVVNAEDLRKMTRAMRRTIADIVFIPKKKDIKMYGETELESAMSLSGDVQFVENAVISCQDVKQLNNITKITVDPEVSVEIIIRNSKNPKLKCPIIMGENSSFTINDIENSKTHLKDSTNSNYISFSEYLNESR